MTLQDYYQWRFWATITRSQQLFAFNLLYGPAVPPENPKRKVREIPINKVHDFQNQRSEIRTVYDFIPAPKESDTIGDVANSITSYREQAGQILFPIDTVNSMSMSIGDLVRSLNA